MRSDTPLDPFGRPLDEQLRALGRQLDEAAPPVDPSELAEATPTTEVAHLVAVDPDTTGVIPLLVPPMADDPLARKPRRTRVFAIAAAALAVVAAGGAAAALSGGDDEVRTDEAALRPVSEPTQSEDPADPGVDLGGFGDVAEAFATCMEGAGFTIAEPGTEDFQGFEALAALAADPAFYDAMRTCTDSSGLADLDVAAELEALDVEGMLEDALGGTGEDGENPFGDTIDGMIDDVLTQLGEVDMQEAAARLDEWLAQMGEEAPALGEQLGEYGAQADAIIACLEDAGWSFDEPPALDDQAAHEQLFADLQACADQG